MAHDKKAVIGTFVKLSTMADGTPRLVLDLDCTLAQIASFNLAPGTPVAIALITPEAAQEDMRSKATAGTEDYGHIYQSLYKLGWFFNKRVSDAFGIDFDLPADERITAIKQAVYTETSSESLKEIPPEYFVAVCDSYGVKNTVPMVVLQAAEGKCI